METLIPSVIQHHLPGRLVTHIEDRGEWARHIMEVTLDNGEVMFLKLHTHTDWLETSLHEQIVTQMLREKGLEIQQILVVDRTCQLMPYTFLIEKQGRGVQLGRLLPTLSQAEQGQVFEAVGRYYAAMHAIRHTRSGVWLDDPTQTFPVTPNEFYLQNEILTGSGPQLVQRGCLSRPIYEQVAALWQENLDRLNAHPSVLLHASPFHWAIALEQTGENWQVCRLGALGDTMWWDPAYLLAAIRYPPFAAANPCHWQAFLNGYQPNNDLPLPEERRLLLYAMLQRLLAASGAFMAPDTPANRAWQANCLADLPCWIARLKES